VPVVILSGAPGIVLKGSLSCDISEVEIRKNTKKILIRHTSLKI
jgi:hypothetical protein